MNRHTGPELAVNRGLDLRAIALGALLCTAVAPAAIADSIENTVAVFAALDKVTARISKLEVPLNQTVRFGSLKVTPRACFSRPPTEPPKTTTFVEVDEILLDGQEKRFFTGWMFAESPGLNAVEHPVFDVWLTQCGHPSRSLATAKGPRWGDLGAEAPPQEPAEPGRRRVRR
jgi:hypothetical protein